MERTIYDYSELIGLIARYYGTKTAFSEAIGKSKAHVSMILHNKRYLEQDELTKWADALKVENEDYGRIFFTLKVL